MQLKFLDFLVKLIFLFSQFYSNLNLVSKVFTATLIFPQIKFSFIEEKDKLMFMVKIIFQPTQFNFLTNPNSAICSVISHFQ